MFNLKRRAIANKIRNDPYYRFQNLTEIAIAVELGIRIDVNQASVDDWLRLPGISIHQGRLLVELVAKGVKLLCIEDIAAALSIPATRLFPLEPVLQFSYYDRFTPLSPEKININQASVAEIAQIPLIKANLAELIVRERQQQGKYHNLADLQRRLALDSVTISQLMYYLQF
ncbi:MAG TPA: helix-hairpin-helix domain-containing protein [Xenococcaceae cyanobacterium]